MDPQPQMPYVILRNMSPHFDSYANSGIPGIKGMAHRYYNGRINTEGDVVDHQVLQLLHLLPHLQRNDVGKTGVFRTGWQDRGRDLQALEAAIMKRVGRRYISHHNHSTTQRLTQLDVIPLQQERRQFSITAANVINILCKTNPPDWTLSGEHVKLEEMNRRDERPIAPSTDYLGYPLGKPGSNGVDTWAHLNRSETGLCNWFGIIAQVCKSCNEVTQKRKSNSSHIHDWHSVIEEWGKYGGRILREIKTSHHTYANLHSIYVGYGAVQNKTQAHKLINLLCDLVPYLEKLHMPATTTEIRLRAAKTLAMRALDLRDSIQLVTWLHGLPTTRAKDFLALIQDSPRATVIHILEGCEQIALLNLAAQGYLPERPLQGPGGHPIREHVLPFIMGLVFERKLFARLTYMQNLITHIKEWEGDIPSYTKNIITYDPLPDRDKGTLPLQRPNSTHLHLGPTKNPAKMAEK